MPLILGGVAAFAVFTGVACGGDDDPDEATTPTIAATQAPARTSTTASSPTAAASPSPSGDTAARQQVQAVVDQINRATMAGDADAFLRNVTDQGLARLFFSTAEQVRADPSIIKTDEPLEPQEITVDGNEAQVQVVFGPPDNGFDAPTALIFRREANAWKLDDVEVLDGDAPAGAETIELTLEDFAFEFDETKVKTGSRLVFETTNDGEQMHEVQLVRIDSDAPLEELLASEGQPEGVTPVGFAGLFSPGDEADLVVTQPLEAGRYAMLCFLPDVDDPEMTPHVAKGMVAEFEIE